MIKFIDKICSFFKKIKGFRDDSIFVDKSWTADSIHDIMQSLLFSDVDMNEKVIQYEIPDENKMFQSLKLLFSNLKKSNLTLSLAIPWSLFTNWKPSLGGMFLKLARSMAQSPKMQSRSSLVVSRTKQMILKVPSPRC